MVSQNHETIPDEIQADEMETEAKDRQIVSALPRCSCQIRNLFK